MVSLELKEVVTLLHLLLWHNIAREVGRQEEVRTFLAMQESWPSLCFSSKTTLGQDSILCFLVSLVLKLGKLRQMALFSLLFLSLSFFSKHIAKVFQWKCNNQLCDVGQSDLMLSFPICEMEMWSWCGIIYVKRTLKGKKCYAGLFCWCCNCCDCCKFSRIFLGSFAWHELLNKEHFHTAEFFLPRLCLAPWECVLSSHSGQLRAWRLS